MGGTYLGAFSVGGCVVGLDGAFGAVGSALVGLNAAVVALNAQLSTQNDAILTAKAAIRIPAIAIPQVQVSASADINVGLEASLSDPQLYLTELLDGLLTVQASLEASLPALQLTETIGANLNFGVEFEAQIIAIDLQLEALVGINLAIGAVITALAQAVLAVSAALARYVSMSASLATVGAHAIIYSGPLDGAGTALDAVTPSTGIPGPTNVLMPIMLVQQSDTPAVNATQNVYRTS